MDAVDALIRTVLLYGLLVGSLYLLTRAAARFLTRTDDTVVGASRLRLIVLVMLFVALLYAPLIGLPSGFSGLLATVVRSPHAIGGSVLFLPALLFGPGLAAWHAVMLGSLPAWRRLKDLDVSTDRMTRRYTIVYFFKAGPLVGFVWLVDFTPGSLLTGAVVAVAYAVYSVTAPTVAARLSNSRPLDLDEWPALAGNVRTTSVPIRVVDESEIKAAVGLASGVLPGRKVIYLSDYLVDQLEPDEVAAVVEHEVAHHRYRHMYQRWALTGALVTIAAVGLSHPAVNSLHVLGISVVLWLGIKALARRQEYEADRFAGEAVGTDAMARALDTFAEVNLSPTELGAVGSRLSSHPSIERRKARLVGQEERAVE